MRIMRTLAGLSILCSSVWMGPAVSQAFGVSEIFGFVTVGSIMAFFGGMIFYSGVRSSRSF